MVSACKLLPQTLEASVAELTTALLQFLIKETQTLSIQKAAPVSGSFLHLMSMRVFFLRSVIFQKELQVLQQLPWYAFEGEWKE